MTRSRTFFSALAGVFVGALLVGVVPAVAGVGDALLLGRTNDGGNKTTIVDSGVPDGPGVRITNDAGGPRAALRVNTVGNAPPFATNSTGKVKKFNSDLLDDLEADQISTIVASSFDGDLFCSNCDLDAVITVPGKGWLVINGGIAPFNAADDSAWDCSIDVTPDGGSRTAIPGSARFMFGLGTGAASCQTNGSLPVDAGTHTVHLECSNAETLVCFNANVDVVFHPDESVTPAEIAAASEPPAPSQR